MSEPKQNVYHISTKSVINVILIILAMGFLWLIRDILGLVFVAIILSSAFNPLVVWLQKFKIPRGLSLLVVFIIIIGAIASVITLVAQPVANEVTALINNFPKYYRAVVDAWDQLQAFGGGALQNYNLSRSLGTVSLPGATFGIVGFLQALFGSIFGFFLLMVITFYLTVEEETTRKFIRSVTKDKYQPYVMNLMTRIQHRLGSWLRGQLILSLIIFTLTYIGLSILGVKYALVLALMAGLFEVVPYIGPIMAAIPAIFLAFQQSNVLALFVLGLYFIVQQLENIIIVPRVMGKITGLNPVVVLLAVLIGAKLAGVVGALMAVPVTTALSVFLEDFSRSERSQND